MANHKSAIKQHNQSLVRKNRNASTLNKVKTFIKSLEVMISENKAQEAAVFFREVESQIMKSVTKGVMKLNTASRKVSRLNAKLKQIAS